MTIGRGESWGRPAGDLAGIGCMVAHSDAEAREIVERARRAGDPVPPLLLLGGDLCRTVGGTGDEHHARGPDALALPCDLGSVLLDGRQHWFVAHLVARRSWWRRGRIVAAMNAQFLGRFDVAPRGHPNDGRVEILDVAPSFGLGDRVKAWRRLPTGTHVPHPRIAVRRVSAEQETFDPPLPVWLDGVAVGSVRQLSLRVEPDALTLII
jgi:YegS C-terminal NAD kinase beta sandwich-like domain